MPLYIGTGTIKARRAAGWAVTGRMRKQWEGGTKVSVCTQICAQTHTPEAPPGGPHPKVPLPNNTSNMPSCKYQFRDRWEMSALPLEGQTPKTKLSTLPGKEFLRCRLPQN